MMDRVVPTGTITLTLRDLAGNETVIVVANLIVDVGRGAIASALTGSATSYPNYLGFGTGTTAVASGQTALVTPVNASWKAIGAKTLYSAYIASFDTTYGTSEANGSYTEIGIFAGASASYFSGTLFARALASITKTSTQSLTVNWRIQVA